MSPRIVLLFLLAMAPIARAAIPAAERDALLALYASTNGASWTNNTGWNGAAGSECSWYGVTCDSAAMTVAQLRLGNNNLSGTIPALAFANLTFLDLKRNRLTGSLPSLADLPLLQFLDVKDNQLAGTLPPLASLVHLAIFDASGNQLSGQLPPAPPALLRAQSSLCPNAFQRLDDADWDAATGDTPWWTGCTPSGPLLLTGTPEAGRQVTFTATPGASRYEWDLDDDGVVDRVGTANTLSASYPRAYDGNVSVTTTSATATKSTVKQPLRILAPILAVAVTGPATEACGNGDGIPQPGERFDVPIRVTNTGFRPILDGYATFVAQDRLDAAARGNAIEGAMTVETPLVAVGDLAPGAHADSRATVTLSPDARCGASYGLLFRGGVDRLSSGPGQTAAVATLDVPADAACTRFTGSCVVAPKALVTAREGLYLDANRPGNGLSHFVIPVAGAAPVYFGAWFTGAPDHNPTWYIVQAPLTGNVAVGPILRFTRDVEAPAFAVRSTTVGTAVVALKGTEQIAFLFQIGTQSGIELMDYFVGGAAPAPDRTGAWYNAGESGWGQVVHAYVANGESDLFVVDYLYDAAGQPRWVLGQGASAGFSAPTPHETFQVHCPGCPWIADWNGLPLAVGTGSERFLDSTNGRTTTSFALPDAFPGAWNRADLPITLLTVPH